MTVNVIGAGLAGSEAAYQLAKRGIAVKLFEMKPQKFTPAHHSEKFAELVCSNSFRANNLSNAVGLLKQEMRMTDSLIMRCADKTAVPAGGALAVDREGFSKLVTDEIKNNPLIEVIPGEVTEINENEYTIVATGPLTSDALTDEIKRLTGNEEYLHFFDAAAPIVTFESVDTEKAFKASRYDKGDADYLNCPMTEEEYNRFYDALVTAEIAELKGFDVFEGCMPIEVMAKRGRDTMLFGPLKPVGLVDKRTNEKSYAVVQLRQDDAVGSLYNIVGFQTNLKWGEQKRVFSMIPGLENAEFVRYGVMHRNTFLNSPKLLDYSFSMKKHPKVFFAGQITGVEGYAESTSSGLMAALQCASVISGKGTFLFPEETALHALAAYISCEGITNFQPMNVNFGIIKPLGMKIRGKREKNEAISARALKALENFDVI
mgnify:FL=1